jgi:putative ABC transport system ATP-binding protein
VTHDSRLEAHADRIVHMEDGRILSDHMVTQPFRMHAGGKMEQRA